MHKHQSGKKSSQSKSGTQPRNFSQARPTPSSTSTRVPRQPRRDRSRSPTPDFTEAEFQTRIEIQDRLNDYITSKNKEKLTAKPIVRRLEPPRPIVNTYLPVYELNGYATFADPDFERHAVTKLCPECITDFKTRNDRVLRIRSDHYADLPSDCVAYRVWWQYKAEHGWEDSFTELRPSSEPLPGITIENIDLMHANVDAEERFWVAFDEAVEVERELKDKNKLF